MLVCNGRSAETARDRFSELTQEFAGRDLNRSNLRSRQMLITQWFVTGIVLRGHGVLCIVELRFGLHRDAK
jgi:hypothetical protein